MKLKENKKMIKNILIASAITVGVSAFAANKLDNKSQFMYVPEEVKYSYNDNVFNTVTKTKQQSYFNNGTDLLSFDGDNNNNNSYDNYNGYNCRNDCCESNGNCRDNDCNQNGNCRDNAFRENTSVRNVSYSNDDYCGNGRGNRRNSRYSNSGRDCHNDRYSNNRYNNNDEYNSNNNYSRRNARRSGGC